MTAPAREAALNLLSLADADLRAAELLGADAGPVRQLALFHAQQTAEKSLKALLIMRGVAPPRTHALGLLLDRCLPSDRDLERMREAAEALTPHGVEPRYVLAPREVDAEVVSAALGHARSIRDAVAPRITAEPATPPGAPPAA